MLLAPILAAAAAAPQSTPAIPAGLAYVASGLFAVAVLHTFATKWFEQMADKDTAHAGLWHLLGEVEVVFGFWAVVLFGVMMAWIGPASAIQYVESRSFAEAAFVFVIMVIAASRPIMELAGTLLTAVARPLPLPKGVATLAVTLTLAPLLGSLITEPAAMTVGALLLRDRIFSAGISEPLKYGILGTLFVNVSIGGTLTPYAAPPILMVAQPWGWDLSFMLANFGWRAVLATGLSVALLVTWYWREVSQVRPTAPATDQDGGVPLTVTLIHVAFAVAAVALIHHPVVLLGLFLVFLGFTQSYKSYQAPLILREALLVALFLAGLVTLGGLQTWWLQPLLERLPASALYYGATALTAITDNAALTYLGSLVEGTTPEFRYALAAGAVTGGGLTIIANAPNPAGVAILSSSFEDETISAWGLFRAALPPTLIAIVAFWLLP